MKTSIVTLVLLAVSTPSFAEPAPACVVKGAPIFQLDVLPVTATTPSATLALYANGAVTIDRDRKDKPATHELSCLAAPAMKTITADLKAATWKVTHSRIHCMAVSMYSTAVTVAGRLVFRERVCNSDALDDVSAAKLADIKHLLPSTFETCGDNAGETVCNSPLQR
jgi:hypothetical protein